MRDRAEAGTERVGDKDRVNERVRGRREGVGGGEGERE